MDITVQNVSKAFAEKQVLCGVNAAFAAGQITCIMGPSGVGKTTLLQIIAGLQKPDSGSVCGVQGQRLSAAFQEDRLLGHLNAVDNIRFVLGRTADAAAITQALFATGLAVQDIAQPAATLSGGQRRRVALVRAMLAPGEIILLDEPFKGLDDATKAQAIEYVKQARGTRTVLCVTHSAAEAAQLGSAIWKMEEHT